MNCLDPPVVRVALAGETVTVIELGDVPIPDRLTVVLGEFGSFEVTVSVPENGCCAFGVNVTDMVQPF